MDENKKQDNEIIFSVTIKDLQNEAINRIGRKLTEYELHTAKKGIESGLSFDIETVFQTAIDESIEEDRKTEH